MGVFARYMKDPEGLRKLVELLETTPLKRREELLDRGAKENAAIVDLVQELIITFRDIIELPQMELTEVLASMKGKSVAYCALSVDEEKRKKILGAIMTSAQLEVNSYLDFEPTPSEIGQAKLAAIKAARELEASGKLNLKRIPRNSSIEELCFERKSKAKRDSSRSGILEEDFDEVLDAQVKDESVGGLAKGGAKLSVVEVEDEASIQASTDFDDLDFDGLFTGSSKDKKKTG